MIKGTATGADGRNLLMIGLSFGNLDKFRAEPGATFIKIDGKEMGLTFDVLIFSGETEAHLHAMVAGSIGPDTKLHIDPKLKS
jgi:hypothetical protein